MEICFNVSIIRSFSQGLLFRTAAALHVLPEASGI